MKILFITLSNLGDVILSLPVLDTLIEREKSAEIYGVTSSRCSEFIESIPEVKGVIIYKKKMNFSDFRKFISSLRKNRYDLVVDLRNSLIPYLVRGKVRTPLFIKVPGDIHSRDKLRLILKGTLKDDVPFSKNRRNFFVSEERVNELREKVQRSKIPDKRIIFFGIGARSHIKRYPPEHFSWLIKRVGEEGFSVILVGDENDREVSSKIRQYIPSTPFLDLCGQTSIQETAFLLREYASFSISCDSAFLHISSYLNVPTLGIFGPTSHLKYGPWADISSVVYNKDAGCRPCQKAGCRYNLECMNNLKPEEVWETFKKMAEI